MGENKVTLDEREALLEKQKRRRRINLYKNLIVMFVCLVAVTPILVSIYLLGEVSDMEKQVRAIAGQRQMENPVKMSVTEEAVGDDVSGQNSDGDDASTSENVAMGKRVYLTFDDGPSENTDEILKILAKNKAKATFFVTGHTEPELMKMYKEIVDQGHGIGIHSYTHNYTQIYSSMDAFEQDVMSMSDLIYQATGVRTHMYRFPGGSANSVSTISSEEMITWLNSQGYIYYDWNALNGDAVTEQLSTDTLIQNVMNSVEKNAESKTDSIVLMHDMKLRHNTVEALPRLIQTLKAKGYVVDEPLTEEVKPVQQRAVEQE